MKCFNARLGRAVIIIGLSALCAASLALAQTPPPASPGPLTVPLTAPPASPAPPSQQIPPPAPAAAPIDAAVITKRANDDVGVNLQETIAAWRHDLDTVEEGLRGPALRYAELTEFREHLERIRGKVKEFWERLRPRLDALKAERDALGAPPAAGQPPESADSIQHRAELNQQLGAYTSAQNEVDGGFLKIEQLINTIQDIRRKNFTTQLFQPVPGIFSSATWERIPSDAEGAASRVLGLVQDGWDHIRDKDEAMHVAAEAALLCLVLTFLAFRWIRRLRSWAEPGEPPLWKRASSAAGVILLRSIPAIAPAIFLYQSITAAQPLPERADWLVYAALRSFIIAVAVYALSRTVFAPRATHWRLIPASDAAARRVNGLLLALALVYGVTTLIYVAARLVQAPFTLTVAVSLPASLIIAALVILILRTPLERPAGQEHASISWLRALRLPIWLLTIAIVLTAFAGYLALSRFIAQQLIVTGSILALIYLLLLWVDGFAQGIKDENATAGRWLKETGGLEQARREQLSVPVSLLLKLGVLLASVPLIMLQWGYVWPDIIDLYHQVFFGFHIGSSQVTLAALAAAVIVFLLGYFASSFFQGWLDEQILQPAGLSGGVRDSIRTTVGYIGILIASLTAFSYAGFDLTSLGYVAGAFSVGIGFGLQSVVSNFVSGLILLAERPIKVGDLVVVAGEEGYVRKISVRSTEIETFDRANVLIPNAYFISEKVKNWTLRNNTGRIAIAVGVSYGCDPRKVKAILLKTAQSHLNVMTTPAPFVDLEEFGADTLDFKLYAYLYDLNKSISTRTDLRMSILDAFNEAGIVIPSRQTDVTLRDIDWLRTAVSDYMAREAKGRDGRNGSHDTMLSETTSPKS